MQRTTPSRRWCLVPVELRRESPREPYELRRVDEDVVINPALSVRLADFGIELPAIDQDDFDLDAVLAEIDDLVAGRDGWEVQRRLLISPFSFHKEVMYRDLLQNAGRDRRPPGCSGAGARRRGGLGARL